jgi:hypothetical protein
LPASGTVEQIDDFIAAQRSEFERAFGQSFELGALLGEHARRFVGAA